MKIKHKVAMFFLGGDIWSLEKMTEKRLLANITT